MPIRVALFDFDGTLADSYRAITASVNHVRALHGLAPLSIAEVRPHVGRGLPYLLEVCVPGTSPGIDIRRYRDHHPGVMTSGTNLLPKAKETLQTLHAAGLKLAICSNKPAAFTRILVQTLDIAQFIAEVVGPEDAPRPKPAPDMLFEVMRRLEVEPADVIYIGDMTVDIQTARGAGVAVWVVPTGSDTREALKAAQPDRILANLSEIPTLIASANSRMG